MGKIIEYTLVSVDGAHSDPAGLGLRRPPLQGRAPGSPAAGIGQGLQPHRQAHLPRASPPM